jgi:aspartate/methionine/tyrosine aminotransferase
MQFEKYPFQKLNELLEGITPNSEEKYILTIGEPQFETPEFIQKLFVKILNF